MSSSDLALQDAFEAYRAEHHGMMPAEVIRSLYARLDRLRQYGETLRREAGRSDVPEDVALLMRHVAALCRTSG